MKRSVVSVPLTMALLFCLTALQASAQNEDSCSKASLNGGYGFLVTGTIIGLGPLAIVGLAKFDGAGNLTRTETAVINGNVLPPETIVGTYSVNPDCTGSTTDALDHHSQFVIVNHRSEILSVGTDTGAVNTISLKKQ